MARKRTQQRAGTRQKNSTPVVFADTSAKLQKNIEF